MSLRRRAHSDSLELLLNTLCTAFGGIVMVSLVMALIAGDNSGDEAGAARASNWNRQIAQATVALDEAAQLQTTLATHQPDATNRLALAAEIRRLNDQLQFDQELTKSNLAIVAALAPNALTDSTSRRATLTNEIRLASEQLDRFKQTHERQLRLPRERATGKKPLYFIVRYNKIYPIQLFQNNERTINTETLDWTNTAEGKSAVPRRDIPANALPPFARQLRDIPAATYSIHFIVYEDSFSTFLAARQIPLQSNYDTGWEFLPSDRPVTFSSTGEAPPAL